MNLRKLFQLAVFMLSASLCAVPGFAAEEPVSGAPGSQTDAKAVLTKMCDFLAQAKQFSVSIHAGYDVLQETGEKIEFGELRKLTLVRPDRIRVDVERSDGETGLVLFDGQEITVFSPKDKAFARAAKPGDVDHAIFYLLNDLQLRLPLAMMFVTRLPSEMERRVRSVEVVEQDTIMDVPCTHLAARTDEVDFQVWIPSQGDPLPRRVVITYKKAMGQPQFRANLSDWNLSPNPPEDFFVFTPPEGVQRIPFLAELEVAKPDVKKVKKGGKQ
ncbi:DUF2092 domain-containing protein [Desulforhabdus amnigena]|jgi:hypothetical protein|uniref:DUF2092 domain-containing protein n=1 Tax=Desulforhabdus amnigena TaxID=40218 RepID=A0A9W6CXQ2_9BACT|nr:DUF2092 domain-containing protein [Desulforhabdus amnigena]NLJ27965.1 DUF2092 domain-containing protein [Deltaproteobacteria bacterium]GLI33751.1 hypothetical protein DAMNIGENAA_11840 [Desulforhabdus amnigena]